MRGGISLPGQHRHRDFGDRQLFGRRLRVLAALDQGDPVRLRGGNIFVPELGKTFSDYISPLPGQAVEAVDAQIDQEGISDSEIKLLSAPCQIDFLEGDEAGMQLFKELLRPGIVQILLKYAGQLVISARRRKNNLKALCHLVKIKILVISPALFGICPGRPDPDDIGQNRCGTDVIQDRDPLVALLDIEAVHKLIDFDGIPDSFFHLGIIEIAPFCSKLRILTHQRHEVGRKSILTPGRPGPDHHVQRDLCQSQTDLGHPVHAADHFLQGRKIGVLPLHQPSSIFTFTQFFCLAVIHDHSWRDDLLFFFTIHNLPVTCSQAAIVKTTQYLRTSPSGPNQEQW